MNEVEDLVQHWSPRERAKEDDRPAMANLAARLPEGWAMGPTHCPIGLDAHPFICSAGYCLVCQWMSAHEGEGPVVRLILKR